MRSKKPFTTLHRLASLTFSAVRSGFRWGLPGGIGIETSTACNRRCYYCPQSWSPHKQKIVSPEVWRMFLFRLKEAGWRGLVSLTFYNEPSTVPHFVNYVRDVAAIGCWPLIFSNGDHPGQIEDWIRAGARRIVVTQHPPSSAKWMADIAEVKRRHPWRVDVKQLTSIIWRSSAVQKSDGTGLGNLNIDGHDMEKCAFSGNMTIGVEGQVLMCCIDYEKATNMGSIMDRPLWEIWKDPIYVNARKQVQAGNPMHAICEPCLGKKIVTA